MEPQAEWNAVEGPDRRATLWEVGLRYRPAGYQMALPFPVEQDMAQLPAQSPWDVMLEEYRTLGLHPGGHFMAMLRPYLGKEVLSSQDVIDLVDGTEVTVSGLAIREPVLVVRGEISRREGTMNIAVHHVVGTHEMRNMAQSQEMAIACSVVPAKAGIQKPPHPEYGIAREFLYSGSSPERRSWNFHRNDRWDTQTRKLVDTRLSFN